MTIYSKHYFGGGVYVTMNWGYQDRQSTADFELSTIETIPDTAKVVCGEDLDPARHREKEGDDEFHNRTTAMPALQTTN